MIARHRFSFEHRPAIRPRNLDLEELDHGGTGRLPPQCIGARAVLYWDREYIYRTNLNIENRVYMSITCLFYAKKRENFIAAEV